MKFANVGWECDDINNDVVGMKWAGPSFPFILRGYQLSLSVMAVVKPALFHPGEYSEILFTASFYIPGQDQDFGPTVLIPSNKGLAHALHGGIGNNGGFCQAILKSYVADDPVANAVNEILCVSDLAIPVPADSTLIMTAAHAGQGPADFECQGVLFYEAAN